ncbi:unnamed protein product [Closterium sp. NIES-54]
MSQLPYALLAYALLAYTLLAYALLAYNLLLHSPLNGMVWYGMEWDGMAWSSSRRLSSLPSPGISLVLSARSSSPQPSFLSHTLPSAPLLTTPHRHILLRAFQSAFVFLHFPLPSSSLPPLHQLLFSPLFIATFFSSLLTLEGRPAAIPDVLKQEWAKAVVANWKVWIPFQFLNFRFVPLHLQVAASNVIALLWNVYLSFASHRGVKEIDAEQGACDPWKRRRKGGVPVHDTWPAASSPVVGKVLQGRVGGGSGWELGTRWVGARRVARMGLAGGVGRSRTRGEGGSV